MRTGSDDGGSFLEVSNSGPVVAPTALTGLFEPFRRRSERTGDIDGHHGLGLSIVKAIAEAHGAEVRAEPRDAGGLVVRVSFPA